MSAEDLDKLFRDKLKNRPVAPSNDAWERLQARMQFPAPQEEAPNPFLVPAAAEEKEERSPVRMWYYSAAAAVTMLLGVGFWASRDNMDLLQPTATVATVQQPNTGQPQITAPAAAESTTGVTSGTAPVEEKTQNFSMSPAGREQRALASVTPSASGRKAVEKKTVSPAATTVKEEVNAAPLKPSSTQEEGLLAVATPAKAQEANQSTSEPETLKIVVKLDNAQATTSLAHASTTVDNTTKEEHPSGSGRVLKGILKQVKNLRDGEKINREELGITKHTFALETRIGNKKITKTIEL